MFAEKTEDIKYRRFVDLKVYLNSMEEKNH